MERNALGKERRCVLRGSGEERKLPQENQHQESQVNKTIDAYHWKHTDMGKAAGAVGEQHKESSAQDDVDETWTYRSYSVR